MITIGRDAVAEFAAQSPETLSLLVLLRSWHYDKDKFILANATAEKLGWTLPKFKAARERLVKAGKIRCVCPGGRGAHDPPIYAWP